jgi:hypothetical protein
MPSDEALDERRAMEALERLMQAGSSREARDVVAAAPWLTQPYFSDRLGAEATRQRQLGHTEQAESMERWQGVLKHFRELGLHEGYLELAIDELARTSIADDHRRILRENPELRDPATGAFMERRAAELAANGNKASATRYAMARTYIDAAQVKDLRTKSPDLDQAISAFVFGFVRTPDPAANRRLLEARPDLLRPPLNHIAGSMFQPDIAAAQSANDLVTLTALQRRQRLFQRCQEVGVEQAFDELAKGVRWPAPGRT